MVKRFRTTIEDQPQVIVISPQGQFVQELTDNLKALHLDAIWFSPEDILSKKGSGGILASAFAIIWLDIPVFGDQQAKKSIGTQLIYALQSTKAPLFYICFDVTHQRQKETISIDPTWASVYLHRLITKTIPRVCVLEYQHVVYPFGGGLSVVQRFISEKISAQLKGTLEGTFCPVWYQSVIEHIVKTVCSTEPKTGKWAGESDVTLSGFEHELRKALQFPSNAGEKMDFPFIFPACDSIPSIPTNEMVSEVSLSFPKFSFLSKNTPSNSVKETIQVIPTRSLAKKSSIRLPTMIGKLALGLGVAAMVGYGVATLVLLTSLNQIRTDIATYVITNQPDKLPSQQHLSVIQSINTYLPVPYQLIGISVSQHEVHQFLSHIQTLREGMNDVETGNTQVAQLYNEIIGRKESSNFSSLRQAIQAYDRSYQQLSSIQARVTPQRDLLNTFEGSSEFSTQFLQDITTVRENLTITKTFLSALETFLSAPTRTVALVVVEPEVQRSLGGIPKEVTLLRFEKGTLFQTQSYPAQELNEMLKGTVSPPEEWKSLGKEQWSLSDGAFSPDGPTAAKQIGWFLSKQLQQEVDAVVVVSTEGIARLLEATGEVSINGSRVSSTTSKTFFATLSAVDPQQPNTGWGRVGEVLVAALQQQDRMFKAATIFKSIFEQSQGVMFVKDTGVATTLSPLGWDGALSTPSCPITFATSECQIEYASLWEHEFSATPSAVYISRSITDDVEVSAQEIVHHRTILYQNTSLAETTGRTYQALVKFITNSDVQIDSIQVGKILLLPTEYQTSSEFGKSVSTFQIKVPPKSQVPVEITYKTRLNRPGGSVVFYEHKQIGMPTLPLVLTTSYQGSYYPKMIAPAAQIEAKKVTFTALLDRHRIFALGF